MGGISDAPCIIRCSALPGGSTCKKRTHITVLIIDKMNELASAQPQRDAFASACMCVCVCVERGCLNTTSVFSLIDSVTVEEDDIP